MRKLKQATLLLCVIGFLGSATALAGSDPEKDCPKDLVCFTIPEAEQLATNMVAAKQRELELEAKVIQLVARKPKRWGVTLGCGAGLGIDLGSGGLEVSPNCGVYYGFRF